MTLPLDPVDPLATEPRYGTVDAVKKAMGITDTSWDAEIKTALVTGETLIDQECGGSFTVATSGGIPDQVVEAANLVGADIFKLSDSQFPAGSDDPGFIGVMDPSSASRSAFNQHRGMLFGLRISRGIA